MGFVEAIRQVNCNFINWTIGLQQPTMYQHCLLLMAPTTKSSVASECGVYVIQVTANQVPDCCRNWSCTLRLLGFWVRTKALDLLERMHQCKEQMVQLCLWFNIHFVELSGEGLLYGWMDFNYKDKLWMGSLNELWSVDRRVLDWTWIFHSVWLGFRVTEGQKIILKKIWRSLSICV